MRLQLLHLPSYAGRAHRSRDSARDSSRSRRDAFELPAADVFQILPLRRGSGRFVKVDGHLIALPDFRANMPGHRDAVFNRQTVDWNKRNYIRRSHAGMRAGMDIQVDQFGGFTHAANGRFLNSFPIAYQSDDRAVVVGSLSRSNR